ncbi:MAG: ammonia channel protein, partial [Chloroflexota bacterium]
LLHGNPAQLGKQFIAVLASWAYSGIMTFILLKVVDATIGLRVPEHEELAGLDVTQHGELAYRV